MSINTVYPSLSKSTMLARPIGIGPRLTLKGSIERERVKFKNVVVW
jgi:hypothetical protein